MCFWAGSLTAARNVAAMTIPQLAENVIVLVSGVCTAGAGYQRVAKPLFDFVNRLRMV